MASPSLAVSGIDLAQSRNLWPPPAASSVATVAPGAPRPTGRAEHIRQRATEQVGCLEGRRLAGVPIATVRRFVEIDGKRLASLLTLGLLVAAFPLLILLYALGSTTAGHGGSLGDALVTQFGLTGPAADTVRSTFASASASRQSATVLTMLGLFYGGLDIAVVVHTAFARAFSLPPMKGRQRVVRGLAWFAVLVLNLLLTEAIQSNLLDGGVALEGARHCDPGLAGLRLLAGHPSPAAPSPPRRGRSRAHGAGGDGHHVPHQARLQGVGRHLVDGYVTPFGPFGVILALVSWAIVVTIGWLLVACTGAVLWERFSDPSVVRSLEVEAPAETARRP